MSNPEKWRLRKAIIHLDITQMYNAILKASGIKLGENECYIRDIKMLDDGEYWEIEIQGAE